MIKQPCQDGLPDAPIVVAGLVHFIWLEPDGTLEEIDARALRPRLTAAPPMLVNGPALARRLGVARFAAFDLLELLAFARPARPCLPTPRGLLAALALPEAQDARAASLALRQAACQLLGEIERAASPMAAAALEIMERGGWLWAPMVRAALATVTPAPDGVAVWRGLSEIREEGSPSPPSSYPIEAAAALHRLTMMIGAEGEARAGQLAYTAAVTQAFQPRDQADAPAIILAEAGTGIGKTAGYLAPASLWAERNEGVVWVATYTRNLQHQIERELDRLYPEPHDKAVKVVVRKGRENYLCLLNLEEALQALPTQPTNGVALGLMARWTAATRNGDLTGGDLPGWLVDILGTARTTGLSDRHGECIYAACPHFTKCFVERSIKLARRAHIVVANHALILMQAVHGGGAGAGGGGEMGDVPQRLVFDEGHHLFDAADSVFAMRLSAVEGRDLRRWLLGVEGGRSRMRGLRRRIEDLILDAATTESLLEVLKAARQLPGDGWPQRLTGQAAQGTPQGVIEEFLAEVRAQLLARTSSSGGGSAGSGMADGSGPRECEVRPLIPELLERAQAAQLLLEQLTSALRRLRRGLLARLATEADSLDTTLRQRIETMGRSLERRAILPLTAWIAMLKSLSGDCPEEFIDWFSMGDPEARGFDIAMNRHWIDPGKPFAATVLGAAHGVIVTSATLTDGGESEDTAASEDGGEGWRIARIHTGARHVARNLSQIATPSPFDYPAMTRIFIVTDVNRDDSGQVAAAYRALFLAAQGGALGLFTAIRRLRMVHKLLAPALESEGFALYAQHVDGMETSQLIDLFRAEADSCLLGTDAVRDGIDVPGRALRLIVFDRVPWPRSDILHKAHRAAFGGGAYDDMLTRLRLKQAFGRLVRRADDRGCFVLLDNRLPQRLAHAFPPGVPVERAGLATVVATVASFLEQAVAQEPEITAL